MIRPLQTKTDYHATPIVHDTIAMNRFYFLSIVKFDDEGNGFNDHIKQLFWQPRVVQETLRLHCT